jgi:hypothetical protein
MFEGSTDGVNAVMPKSQRKAAVSRKYKHLVGENRRTMTVLATGTLSMAQLLAGATDQSARANNRAWTHLFAVTKVDRNTIRIVNGAAPRRVKMAAHSRWPVALLGLSGLTKGACTVASVDAFFDNDVPERSRVRPGKGPARSASREKTIVNMSKQGEPWIPTNAFVH